MKLFFKKMLDVIQTLINGNANKHQLWLLFGTLAFGLIISLPLEIVSTILLMYVGSIIAELTYCFVPFTYVGWGNCWLKIPNFKEFKRDVNGYIMNPKHVFNLDNFYYVLLSIILFICLKILFLIF